MVERYSTLRYSLERMAIDEQGTPLIVLLACLQADVSKGKYSKNIIVSRLVEEVDDTRNELSYDNIVIMD